MSVPPPSAPSSRWSIRAHVLVGPVSVLGVLLASLGFAAAAMNRLDATAAVVRRHHTLLVRIAEMERLATDLETGVRGYSLTSSPAFLEPYERALGEIPAVTADARAALDGEPEGIAAVARFEEKLADWRGAVAEPQMALVRDGGDAAAFVATGAGKRRMDAIRAELAALEAREEAVLEARLAEDARIRDWTRGAFGAAALLGVLGTVGLAAAAARRTAAPVEDLAAAANRVAGGDYALRLSHDGPRELGETAHAFERMAAALAEARIATEARNRAIREEAAAAEAARREAHAVLDAASDAMVLVGPDGVVRSVNVGFGRLLGIDAPRVVGRPLSTLGPVLGEALADPEALVTRATPEGAGGHSDRVVLAQTAPVARELYLLTTPVEGADGAPAGRLVVLRDVTREREIDRMKSEFVSLVSHEFRTPLTSIKGYVDLLLDGEAGPISPDQADFLGVVRANADRLVALVNDLLDLSRIESGRLTLDRRSVDVSAAVGHAARTLRPQAEAKRITLTTTCAPDAAPISGDPDRVVQILTNLLSNAVKYTPEGGHVYVRLLAAPGEVVVEVEDDGVGIAPEDRELLFTRFYRARNRATAEAQGTGLGLAITRSLVEMHGGRIEVESAPGEGSTFRVCLPAAPPPPAAEVAAPATSMGSVLVVEDEPDIAALVRRYLERGGYGVRVAATAREALALARAERPALVALDVLLPDADGFTVLEWLKSDPDTADVPVLVLSMLPEDGRGQRLGALDWITKPVDERTLLGRVGRWVAPGRPATVLVVDDEPDVRRVVALLVERAGHAVLLAADGAEGVAVARAKRPDLVLLDVRMPVLDGVAAWRALRADPATADIPVVMMTASPGAAHPDPSVPILPKPLDPEALADAIAAALRPSETA